MKENPKQLQLSHNRTLLVNHEFLVVWNILYFIHCFSFRKTSIYIYVQIYKYIDSNFKIPFFFTEYNSTHSLVEVP